MSVLQADFGPKEGLQTCTSKALLLKAPLTRNIGMSFRIGRHVFKPGPRSFYVGHERVGVSTALIGELTASCTIEKLAPLKNHSAAFSRNTASCSEVDRLAHIFSYAM